MDDERKPITYECPVCNENQRAIYTYKSGKRVHLPGNVYITGMCGECLQRENPSYYRDVKAAEVEANTWKRQQVRNGRLI